MLRSVLAATFVHASAIAGHRQGLRRITSGLGNIRFMSFIGTEGSGHHLLTPVVRKLMNLTLVDTQDLSPARHDNKPTFKGGEDLFEAFRVNDMEAFRRALHQYLPGYLVQQEYSFPTNSHRSPDSRIYNVTDLYRMLTAAGVQQKAVIKYERDQNDSAESVFSRWPSLCDRHLHDCEEQQAVYDKLIEDHLKLLTAMKVPLLRIGLDLLRQNCTKFGLKVLNFFQESNLLLPNSLWRAPNQERTLNFTGTACEVLARRQRRYLKSIDAHD